MLRQIKNNHLPVHALCILSNSVSCMVRLLSALKLVSSVIAVIVDVVEAVGFIVAIIRHAFHTSTGRICSIFFLISSPMYIINFVYPLGRILLRCVLIACTPTLDILGVDVSFEGKDNVTESPLPLKFFDSWL